jgi:hypothetical protein
MLPYNITVHTIICIFYELYSTLFHLLPLRFHCVGGWDKTQDLLRLRHWQLDALTTRLDLIHDPHMHIITNTEGVRYRFLANYEKHARKQ